MKKLLVTLLSASLLIFFSCKNDKHKYDDDDDVRAEIEKEVKKKLNDSIEMENKLKEREQAIIDSMNAQNTRPSSSSSSSSHHSSSSGKNISHSRRNIDYGADEHAMIESFYYDVSNRRLTESDIAYMDNDELSLLRNLIYAKHGYSFKQSRYMNFFLGYSWYSPTYADVSSFLSSTESANVAFIKRHER